MRHRESQIAITAIVLHIDLCVCMYTQVIVIVGYRRTGFYCEVKLLRTEVCRGLCESNCCDRPPDHYYYRLHDVFLANLIIAGYTGTRKLAIIGLPQ